MNFYIISSLVNFLTSIILCLALISKEKRTKIELWFIGLALSVAFWSFGYFFWQQSTDAESAIFWSRLFLAGAISIAIFYLHFITELLNISHERTFLRKLSDVIFPLFIILDFTPLMIKGVAPEMHFNFWPQPGIAFHFFLGFWLFYVVYASILLYRGYKSATGVFKLQIKQVSTGLFIGYAGGLTNYFLWYGINIPPFGNILVSIYIIFAFYAIVKYKMFNVKIIATELFVLGLLAMAAFQFFGDFNNAYLQTGYFALIIIVGIFLVRSVLTEVKQKEQLQKLSADLESANQQLKQLDAAKSEFLSVASHQLRTPLTAIKGYASMFLAGDFGPVSDPQRKNIQVIFDSAQRLAVLVSDLLDLSRIESGRMEFDFKAVNLCQTIESVITEVTPKAKDRKLYVFFDNVNRACPDVKADEEKLRQVVINLIDNAIKYTLQGGVTVRLMQVDGHLQFSVTDTGIGVDPKEKDKLFEKFFRTQAANEVTREGTGLGIYVVKKIVESHGGKIWFDSPGVNKGTTFYFTLPIPSGPIKEEKVKIDSLEAF